MTVCTIYDDSISYDESILYDGECFTPQPSSPRGGGVHIRIINEVDSPLDRRRRREDDEILILKPGRGV